MTGLAFTTNADGNPTDWSGVPERYRAGLDRWIALGVVPGGFLQAVLRNELVNAVTRADDADGPGQPQLRPILLFLIGQAPSACWGSPERCEAWEADGGLAGRRAGAEDLLTAARAAAHALKSYACGNASPDLAEGVAASLDAAIARAEGRAGG